MIDKQLTMDALAKWGYKRQENMCIEEVGEFLQAWNKRNRDPETEEKYLEEIVDCYIMFSQMRHIYGERFEKMLAKKIEKTTKKVYKPTPRIKDR